MITTHAECVPGEVYAYLVEYLEVCDRIQISFLDKPASSPLVSFARSHMAKFVAKMRAAASKVLSDMSTPCASQDDSLAQCFRDIHPLMAQCMQAVEVMNFCDQHEKHGQEGELNAIYARIILDSTTDTDSPRPIVTWSKKARAVRFQKARDTIDAMIVSWWSDEWNDWWPEFIRASSCIANQNSPRYIHPYATTDEIPYRIDSSVTPSQGSFGIVRKVVHDQLSNSFAQKTFQNIFSESDRKNVLREIGVLELCHHPNIIEFVEAYEVHGEPDVIHLVMAPWAPYTLLQFLRSPDVTRQVRCPWTRAGLYESDACIYRVMYEMADAVGYLHGISIKHKDIKPDNILLRYEGTDRITPLLTDVGVSKVYMPGGETDYFKGSYQYLAPEQLESRESSLKADIWQLGCCFAMICSVASGGTLAGERLWNSFESTKDLRSCCIATEHESFMEVLSEICTPEGTALEGKHLHNVVTRMLDKDSLRRVDIEMVKAELDKLPRHRRPENESTPAHPAAQ